MTIIEQSRALIAALNAAQSAIGERKAATKSAIESIQRNAARIADAQRQAQAIGKLIAALDTFAGERAASPVPEGAEHLAASRAALVALGQEMAKIINAALVISSTLAATLTTAEQAEADAEQARKDADAAYASHKAAGRKILVAARGIGGALSFPADIFAAASQVERDGGEVLTPTAEELEGLRAEAEIQAQIKRIEARRARLLEIIQAPTDLADLEEKLVELRKG